MVLERSYGPYTHHAVFLTLTYKVDPGQLNPYDFQCFMKRLRERQGVCRYFAVGEYGDKHERGHWHAIVFNPAFRKFSYQEAWSLGNVDVKLAEVPMMAYVAKYCTKPDTGDLKPVCLMSRRPGLGFDGIDQMALAASKTALVAWPQQYRAGGKQWPFCSSGLARFQCKYEEFGGVPPPVATPEMLHIAACLELRDRGSQIAQKEAWAVGRVRKVDKHGLKTR